MIHELFWDREQLYRRVWAKPLTKLGPDYGVSTTALWKVCQKLQVPLPGRGHWSKSTQARPITRPPLPHLRGSFVVRRRKELSNINVAAAEPFAPTSSLRAPRKALIKPDFEPGRLVAESALRLRKAPVDDRGIIRARSSDACLDLRVAAAAGGRMHPAYANWTLEQTIAAMDNQGVTTAVLSLTTPGVWFGNSRAAAQAARRVNEYAADLVRGHPGRFGLFAVIPLPDTESSLREIDYAFAALKADGIGLLTSYDDQWLGSSSYEPVFEELNRRKAVVFVHPTTGMCCRTLLPDVNPIMLEIPQDTTRAVTNLLFSGSFTKFKDIRFIFSHAGGTVPMMVNRMHQYGPKDIAAKVPNGIEYELRRLHYDIAGTAYRPAIAALMNLVSTSQILFGSDHPFIPLADTAEGMKQLGFSVDAIRQIGRENALSLLPRFKAI